jgi:hypothetical protein
MIAEHMIFIPTVLIPNLHEFGGFGFRMTEIAPLNDGIHFSAGSLANEDFQPIQRIGAIAMMQVGDPSKGERTSVFRIP